MSKFVSAALVGATLLLATAAGATPMKNEMPFDATKFFAERQLLGG